MTYTTSQFEPELRAFDNATAPKDATVFYGSSSFRLWDNIGKWFPERTVVNRGFGGSTLAECVELLPRLIYPLQPAALVLYAADNDLDQGASPEHTAYWFAQFMTRIREYSTELPVAFISVKPSPSRFWNIAKIRRANELIRDAAATYPGVSYLDVFSLMLSAEGGPRKDLFTEDGLHMNATGYELWRGRIKAWLDALPAGGDSAREKAN